MIGEALKVGAVGVDLIQVGGAIALRGKDDRRPIGRPGGVVVEVGRRDQRAFAAAISGRNKQPDLARLREHPRHHHAVPLRALGENQAGEREKNDRTHGDASGAALWASMLRPRQSVFACAVAATLAAGCGASGSATSLTFSGSALGPEGDVVKRQLARFAEQHPGVDVSLRITPDAADQRHQLYVQWLNPGFSDVGAEPDVLGLIPSLLHAGATVCVRDGRVPLGPRVREIEDFITGWASARRL